MSHSDDEDDQLQPEREAEPWVQSVQRSWEHIYSDDELAEASPFNADPIDRFLYDAWAALRQMGGAIAMRLGSNWPMDDQVLGAAGRRAALEALPHFGAARRALEEAIGEERVLAFEQELAERIEREAWGPEGRPAHITEAIEDARRRFEEDDQADDDDG